MLEKQTIAIADIRVPQKRKKTLSVAKLEEIAESIIEVGQTVPIQVRIEGERYILIEGLHRLEALRALGEVTIETYVVRARLH